MSRRRTAVSVAQAWVELRSDDPEAVSALAVARAHLSAGRSLRGLRRLRLFEIRGVLPARAAIEDLLHHSIQFYNPHKERCTVRAAGSDPAPLSPGEHAVLVWERDGERRAAAERWWLHETGTAVEVREGIAWVLAFEPGANVASDIEDLALVRDQRHGLLCNPNSQEYRISGGEVPLRWIGA